MIRKLRPVVERWEDKLLRLHPTIQKGKWPKSWREEAIEQELLEIRAEHDALLAEREGMEAALREARNVIATALRASAPDWFEADEDIASHHTIKKIDACLQGAQP